MTKQEVTKRRIVKKRIKKNKDVYDITVKNNHNFFANGILVHNCSEKNLPPYGICNLGSINMGVFSENNYKKEIDSIIPYLVRLQDNVIQYELYYNLSPLNQQKWILNQTREIGLGVTNLHGWLLKQDLQYDSNEAIEKSEEFLKYYAYKIFETSVKIGEEKGSAPGFLKASPEDFYKKSTYFKNIVDYFYDGNYNEIKSLRNIAHVSCAPTGSISSSFPQPCISSGIEPIIAPYYWRRTRAISKGAYDYYFIIPDRVKEYILNKTPQNSYDYNKLYEFNGSELDNDGKIGNELIEVIKKYISDEFFKPAHKIDYNKKLELLSNFYKWVDASISCTFNLPASATKEDIKDIYLKAYEKEVKAVSIYREESREGILIFEDPVTHKNKHENKNNIRLERPDDILYHCAPKRPKELDCNIHHTTVKGEKWLVIIGLFDGKPYELFAGNDDELFVSKSIDKGTLIKNGSGKYNLLIKVRKREVEHKDIADVLMSAEQRTITRMISTCLRHGVPVEFITDQLKKSKADISDFSSAVSRVLSKYETNKLLENENCPNCGEPMISHEGCLTCLSCQYSRCQ